MYPTGFGVLRQEPIQCCDCCIRSALVFCSEIRSNLGDQVFDKFSTSLEVSLNYLVICFKSLYYMLQVVSTWGGVLEYIFLVVFRLLVSSKLDSYDVCSSLRGSVRRVRFESLGFWG
jgi:hypothetical protein